MAAKNAQIERKVLVARAWLVAPELARVTSVVAAHYRLNAQDAEDVLQETRIALWQAGLELRVCRAWVIRTAAHKAIDLIRRTVSRSDHEKASTRAAAPGENALELEYLLHARIAGLPAPLRVLYELHYARGLTERETAVELGVCRQTVRWLDSRCRRSLTGSEALSGPHVHPRDPPCDEK